MGSESPWSSEPDGGPKTSATSWKKPSFAVVRSRVAYYPVVIRELFGAFGASIFPTYSLLNVEPRSY